VIGVNASGIPEKCPNCGARPKDGKTTIEVRVDDFDEISRDGDVVCAACGHFLRVLNT
jgi:hypothetical protein